MTTNEERQEAAEPRRAEVRRLRDEDGLSWAAIGARLGVSMSTARSLYHWHDPQFREIRNARRNRRSARARRRRASKEHL